MEYVLTVHVLYCDGSSLHEAIYDSFMSRIHHYDSDEEALESAKKWQQKFAAAPEYDVKRKSVIVQVDKLVCIGTV